MSSLLRTMKRKNDRDAGTALPGFKNTRGQPKGPARSPTQKERLALARAVVRMAKAKANG